MLKDQWFMILKISHTVDTSVFNVAMDGAALCHIFKFIAWTVSIMITINVIFCMYYAKIVVRVLMHIASQLAFGSCMDYASKP
jgi:hypothetical protein